MASGPGPRRVALVGLVLLCLGGAARAERKTVAVLDVPGVPRVQVVLAQALRKSYTLMPLPRWNATARRLGAMGRAADELALVAAELGVDVVVTATVKKDKDTGTWVLAASVRSGQTGKAVEKLRYPLKGPRVDPATLRQLAAEIGPAVDRALRGQTEQPVVEAPQPEPAAPPGREENPFEAVQRTAEAPAKEPEPKRPLFYPWFDVGAGFILGGRRFSFTEEPGPSPIKCYTFDRRIIDPSDPAMQRTVFRYSNALRKCPGFSASVAGGLRLDGTVYPLAWLSIAPLRGLGVGATFDYFFWPASRVCNKNADGMCISPGTELETRQIRAEVGLRWMWNVLNKRSRPSILLSLMYGFHQFAIQKEKRTYEVTDPVTRQTMKVEGIDDHGLPDLRYQYLDIGLGGRVPYVTTNRFFAALLVDFHYHVMLDYGDIQTRFIDFDQLYGGYGPVGGGYGLRVGFTPVEFVWKGLTARLSGYYETFAMSFDLANPDKGNPLPPGDREAEAASRHIAQGATDQYFGGILQVGYQY